MFNSFAIDHIVGDSAWAKRIRKRILQVASYNYNVLITGPSGTGKELVARAVHAHSSRRDKPFIPVDCAAIPSGLFASQLFGHVKGAFTSAANSAMGCFRAADGGTIFLDEIGELDQELQAKLLRVLQEKQVVPVGGHAPVPVNVRVVAATHRDLQQEVKAGRFRLDLYYRLNVVRVMSEPLKQRVEDIPALAEHFLAKAAVDNGVELKRFAGAMARLQSHDWPGNVRELEHAIERAVIFQEGNLLNESAFADLFSMSAEASPVTPTAEHIPTSPRPSFDTDDHDEFDHSEFGPCEFEDEVPAAIRFTPPADSPAARLMDEEDEREEFDWPTLADVEMAHIQKTLKETFYNQSAAARLLGIDRKQLARKIKKYDLRVPRLVRGRPVKT